MFNKLTVLSTYKLGSPRRLSVCSDRLFAAVLAGFNMDGVKPPGQLDVFDNSFLECIFVVWLEFEVGACQQVKAEKIKREFVPGCAVTF